VTPVGIGPRDVVSLARHARTTGTATGPILVRGILADKLAAELRAGADPGGASLVRTHGDPADAVALVCVVAGPATPADEADFRSATRALVPVIAVQTGDSSASLPYVLATDVVDCEPGRGFPVAEIVRTLARVLGRDAAPFAAGLPVLRDAVGDRRRADGALAAGALALSKGEPHLPLLALTQARMLTEGSAAEGRPTPETPRALAEAVGAPLAAALATGFVARTLVRRLPLRGRVVDGIVAAAATYALAGAFGRVERGLRDR
jgi:uncharacterized protein (DUF697 family)